MVVTSSSTTLTARRRVCSCACPRICSLHPTTMSTAADLRAQLLAASLPPHLKMMILQQASAGTGSGAGGAGSVAAAHATSPVDQLVLAASDSVIPPPFHVTQTVLERAADRAPGAFITAPMLQALETHGFAIIDGFPRAESGGPSSSSSVQRALDEARELYASNRMAHAGMRVAAAATAAGTEAMPAATASAAPSASASGATAGATAASAWKSTDLRGDHHVWLHADSASERERSPALFQLVDRMDALRGEINTMLRDEQADAEARHRAASGSAATAAAVAQAAPLSQAVAESASSGWRQSIKTQVQLACYRGEGARYVSHRDSIPGQPPHRRLTCICYLNAWSGVEQGGCLRLHTKHRRASSRDQLVTLPYFDAAHTDCETPTTPPADSILLPPASAAAFPAWVDIAPLAHRLLLFSSAETLHEVRPSHAAERFAITMWME